MRTTHDVSLDSHSAQRSLPSRCRTAAHRLNCSPLDVVTVPIGTVVHIHVKKAISARRTTTGPWRHSVEGADLHSQFTHLSKATRHNFTTSCVMPPSICVASPRPRYFRT